MAPNDIDVVGDNAARAPQQSKNVVENANGSKTLPLKFPVTVKLRRDGKEVEEAYKELTFRRMNGADLRAISGIKDEGVLIARVFTRLTGIPDSVFDALDAEDILGATEIVNGFFPDGLMGGGFALAR